MNKIQMVLVLCLTATTFALTLSSPGYLSANKLKKYERKKQLNAMSIGRNLIKDNPDLLIPAAEGIKNEVIALDPETYGRPKPDEVKWRDCSAKKIFVYLETNVQIICEMVIPLGSTVKWAKNGRVVRTNWHPFATLSKSRDVYDTPLGRDLMEDKNVELRTSSYSNNYKFHLMSTFYLDCLKPDDLTKYEILIETPNGNTYKRSFELLKMDGPSISFSRLNCWIKMYRSYKDFDPRISEFAKKVIGKRGQSLTLPCRPVKLTDITITWDKYKHQITNDSFSITQEGDLQIFELKPEDQGMYTCDVSHHRLQIPYDRIVTYIEVRD